MSDSISAGVIEDWCDFGHNDERVYILMAIARRKHNDELTHNSEIVYRKVIHDEGEIYRAYEDLRSVINSYPYTFRLYLTVNARNVVDAYFNFQETMNKWSRELLRGDGHAAIKMGEIDSRWKSELHAPEAKDDSYFQFDLDDVSSQEAARFVEALREVTEVLTWRATPNGYHVLTEPFNYTEWTEPIEYDDLSTDGMLFVDEIDGVAGAE